MRDRLKYVYEWLKYAFEWLKRRLHCFFWGHIAVLVLGGDIMCAHCGKRLRP